MTPLTHTALDLALGTAFTVTVAAFGAALATARQTRWRERARRLRIERDAARAALDHIVDHTAAKRLRAVSPDDVLADAAELRSVTP